MTQTALPLLAQCFLALAAFASLCLATPRHIHQLNTPNPQNWRTPLRGVGWILLIAALATAVLNSGWGLGLVEWFGALTLAAVTVVLIATYRPTWLKGIALVSLVFALGTVSLTV